MDAHFINLENHEDDICRICFETDNNINNRLIVPCKCSGSSRFIHEQCLTIWRRSNMPNSDPRIKCMECNFKYQIIEVIPKLDLITKATYICLHHTLTCLFIFILFFLTITLSICNQVEVHLPIVINPTKHAQ